MAVRDRYDDLRLLLGERLACVVDGGAHKGSVTARLLERFAIDAVHAFEPIPELAAHIRRRFARRPEVTVHGAALAEHAGRARFHVTGNRFSSSLLRPSSWSRHLHGRQVDAPEPLEVPTVRLDDVLGGRAIDLIKLDLQGGELSALRGGAAVLAQTRAVLAEVEFIPLYEGQPLFADLDAHLRSAGFRLFNLYELFTLPDGQLTSGDAIFLNQRHFPPPTA